VLCHHTYLLEAVSGEHGHDGELMVSCNVHLHAANLSATAACNHMVYMLWSACTAIVKCSAFDAVMISSGKQS
jgi:hypothetical protein